MLEWAVALKRCDRSSAQGAQAVVKCAQALMNFLLRFGEYFLEFHVNWICKPYDIKPLRHICL